jgi:glucuronoarabinoxylan endo-1,4-beta-xylanase
VADAEANRWVDIHSGHSYGNGPSSPLPAGGRRTWMTEWSPDGTTWNENWDDGSGYDGLTVAQAIHTGLTAGNINGYVYWYGVSTGATRGFIQANGANYRASKRLWAMAGYSRFIRPGANRVGASTSDGNLRLSAYRNSDGSIVVVALNAAASATEVSYSLQSTGITTGTAVPYITNNANNMTVQQAIVVNGGAFTATVPARSLATYLIRPGAGPTSSPSPSGCITTLRDGTRWTDRFNTEVTVNGTTNWTVVVALTPAQRFSSAWNASAVVNGNLVTLRANGNGNVFGITTLANGDFTRPRVQSCSPT